MNMRTMLVWIALAVSDVLEICMHKSDNSYGWVQIVAAP